MVSLQTLPVEVLQLVFSYAYPPSATQSPVFDPVFYAYWTLHPELRQLSTLCSSFRKVILDRIPHALSLVRVYEDDKSTTLIPLDPKSPFLYAYHVTQLEIPTNTPHWNALCNNMPNVRSLKLLGNKMGTDQPCKGTPWQISDLVLPLLPVNQLQCLLSYIDTRQTLRLDLLLDPSQNLDLEKSIALLDLPKLNSLHITNRGHFFVLYIKCVLDFVKQCQVQELSLVNSSLRLQSPQGSMVTTTLHEALQPLRMPSLQLLRMDIGIIRGLPIEELHPCNSTDSELTLELVEPALTQLSQLQRQQIAQFIRSLPNVTTLNIVYGIRSAMAYNAVLDVARQILSSIPTPVTTLQTMKAWSTVEEESVRTNNYASPLASQIAMFHPQCSPPSYRLLEQYKPQSGQTFYDAILHDQEYNLFWQTSSSLYESFWVYHSNSHDSDKFYCPSRLL